MAEHVPPPPRRVVDAIADVVATGFELVSAHLLRAHAHELDAMCLVVTHVPIGYVVTSARRAPTIERWRTGRARPDIADALARPVPPGHVAVVIDVPEGPRVSVHQVVALGAATRGSA